MNNENKLRLLLLATKAEAHQSRSSCVNLWPHHPHASNSPAERNTKNEKSIKYLSAFSALVSIINMPFLGLVSIVPVRSRLPNC